MVYKTRAGYGAGIRNGLERQSLGAKLFQRPVIQLSGTALVIAGQQFGSAGGIASEHRIHKVGAPSSSAAKQSPHSPCRWGGASPDPRGLHNPLIERLCGHVTG